MVWKNSIYKDRFRHNYTFSSKKCLSYITAKSMSSTLQIDVFKNAKHIWKKHISTYVTYCKTKPPYIYILIYADY